MSVSGHNIAKRLGQFLVLGALLANVLQAAEPVSSTPSASVRYTKQDAELWKARVAELAPQAMTARKSAVEATKVLDSVKQELQVLNKEATDAQSALKTLVPKAAPRVEEAAPAKPAPAPAAGKTAAKDAPAKKEAPASASKQPGPPAVDPAKVAAAKARLQEISDKQKEARRKLTQAEQSLKQAETVRDSLSKNLAEAESLQKQAEQRLALLLKSPQTAKPENARLLQTFTAPRSVLTARWDRAGQGFYVGMQGSDVLQYDLYRSGSPIQELKGHHSWVAALDLAPVEPLLVTAAYNGHLIWWNTSAKVPSLMRDLVGHKGFIRAVAFSPDGRFLASCGNDAVVRVWAANGGLVKELNGHASHVYNVAFHPSGKFLISGDLMGNLKQWDTSTWQMVRELDARVLEKYDEIFVAHCGGIRSLDFSADGRQLVVSGVSDVTNAFAGIAVPTAVLFDWETGKRTRVMKPQNPTDGSCWGVRFSPAGDFIVGAGGRGSGSLWFWKPTEEKSFFDLRLPNVPYDVEFHPDGLRLLLPMYEGTVRVYDLGPKFEAATPAKPAPTKKK